MNINQYGEYTKHYYAEDQRIASKIGTGSVLEENLCDNLEWRFNIMPHELDNPRYFAENKIQYDLTLTTIPDTWVDIDSGGINICALQDNGANNYEDELFFYHGNHLSSTQMITDSYSNVVQQVHYAPFGEVILEYDAYWHQGKIPDYMFNAKELDEENGMYYYEARYYNPPTFISRDPLFEKYPTLSPYNYCLNNPLRFIDPTGMSADWVEGIDGTIYWDENATSQATTKEGETYLGKEGIGFNTETGNMTHYKSDGTTSESTLSAQNVTISAKSTAMEKYYKNEYQKAKGIVEKMNYGLNYLSEVLGLPSEKQLIKAAEKPLQKIANMNPLMYIGHVAAGIKSGGEKDAFENDMDAMSWGAMGVGVPFSIFGAPATSTLVPLGLDIGNDVL
jgi:RHS repeat-associated protein